MNADRRRTLPLGLALLCLLVSLAGLLSGCHHSGTVSVLPVQDSDAMAAKDGSIRYHIPGSNVLQAKLMVNPYARLDSAQGQCLWKDYQGGTAYITTPPGTTQEIQLPDHSVITINGGALLSINTVGKSYAAQVTGDAHFHLAAGCHPVEVGVSKWAMLANGPGDFYVSEHGEDAYVLVASRNADVTVDEIRGIRLHEGQKCLLHYHKDAVVYPIDYVKEADPGYLNPARSYYFFLAPLHVVARAIAEEYGKILEYSDSLPTKDSLPAKIYTGIVDFNKPIDSLGAFAETLGIRLSVKDKILYVSPR